MVNEQILQINSCKIFCLHWPLPFSTEYKIFFCIDFQPGDEHPNIIKCSLILAESQDGMDKQEVINHDSDNDICNFDKNNNE